MNAVSKLFFRMHLLLQIWTDPFHVNHPVEVPHSACAFLGDLAIFGDLATYFIFIEKLSFISGRNVLIVTSQWLH